MTSDTTWHADPVLLQAYVEGRLDAVLGASLERHVDACAECRAAIRPLTDQPTLEHAWERVRSAVETPALPWPLRIAVRIGLPEPQAILLSAAASLRTAWLVGSIVALGFAVGATSIARDGVMWPFLLVAPLIPVLGVAAAYGSTHDEFEALAVPTPYGRTRLTLLRAVAVVVTTLPLAAAVGATLPWPTWVAIAWLGPAVALVPVLLAIASFVGPRLAGSVVALGWSAVVLLSVRRLPATWPVEPTQQYAYVTLAVVAIAVLVVRSISTRKIGVVL